MAVSTGRSPSVPPGRTGLPVLGETLPFLKDGFGFVARRTAAHGPVWKTRLLGRDTAVLVGPEAAGRFIGDAMPRGGLRVRLRAR